MVEISLSGSGEGPGGAIPRGYSTTLPLSSTPAGDQAHPQRGSSAFQHAGWRSGQPAAVQRPATPHTASETRPIRPIRKEHVPLGT